MESAPNLIIEGSSWGSKVYQETVLIVLGVLFIGALIVFLFRKKNHYFIVSWASIKSWLFVAPILFIVLGLPQPWPLLVLTLIAINGAKVFFQLMGMYNRSYFVLICYLGILGLTLSILFHNDSLYNLMPMLVLGASCLVPLLRNNYQQMIQYISLTNLAFVFLGWCFMHMAMIMSLQSGIYQLMYLTILTEVCDNTNLAISSSIGGTKIFDRIDRRRTWGGFYISIAITILLAFGMRHMLPDRSDYYWLVSGVVASIGGLIGDMLMTVVRRDAGIKVVGAFVFGRGDFLHRMDRLIFVAPIYYYVMLALPKFLS